MALTTQQIIDVLEPTVEALRPADDIHRARRVDRAIDTAGRVIQEPRPFVRLRSPDGSVWRVKVSNTGAITTAKETA